MDLKKKKDHTTQKEWNRNEWFQQRLEKGSPKMREKTPGETHSIRATSDQRRTGKNWGKEMHKEQSVIKQGEEVEKTGMGEPLPCPTPAFTLEFWLPYATDQLL